jgi:hypothetical protein
VANVLRYLEQRHFRVFNFRTFVRRINDLINLQGGTDGDVSRASGAQKNSQEKFCLRTEMGKTTCFGTLPPPPPSFKSRDWRGVYKIGLQNLEPQGFRGQNLENKALAIAFSSNF